MGSPRRFAGGRASNEGKEFMTNRITTSRDPAESPFLTFEDLARRERRLKALADRVRRYRVDARRQPRSCANAVWYGYGGDTGIKPSSCK
jgi:hypothetical protein